MAAATSDLYPLLLEERHAAKAAVQKANTTIYLHALCMQDAGKVRPVATGVAGAKLLGWAKQSYGAVGGSDVTWSPQMIFGRGAIALQGAAGALPTAANIQTMVRLDDDQTVSTTAIGANDQSVKLLAIEDGVYICEVA